MYVVFGMIKCILSIQEKRRGKKQVDVHFKINKQVVMVTSFAQRNICKKELTINSALVILAIVLFLST